MWRGRQWSLAIAAPACGCGLGCSLSYPRGVDAGPRTLDGHPRHRGEAALERPALNEITLSQTQSVLKVLALPRVAVGQPGGLAPLPGLI